MHSDADRENVRHRGKGRGREALSETKKCNVRQGGHTQYPGPSVLRCRAVWVSMCVSVSLYQYIRVTAAFSASHSVNVYLSVPLVSPHRVGAPPCRGMMLSEER